MKVYPFTLFLALLLFTGLGGCGEAPAQLEEEATPAASEAAGDSPSDLANRYKVWYEILLDSVQRLESVIAEKEKVIARQKARLALDAKAREEKAAQGEYTYGVPPAPPFRKLSYTGGQMVMEDCEKGPPLTGYVIEADLEDYTALIQDEFGVRNTYSIEVDADDLGRKDKVPKIFIPGMKVRLEMQYCGSGGYGSILSVQTLKR
ncbi:MAG TPA: hypothetical protein VJ933_05050 [Phaeodactylibacter sp.]|nr:hypothetical protein [Phaeodactylibacter sp.]